MRFELAASLTTLDQFQPSPGFASLLIVTSTASVGSPHAQPMPDRAVPRCPGPPWTRSARVRCHSAAAARLRPPRRAAFAPASSAAHHHVVGSRAALAYPPCPHRKLSVASMVTIDYYIEVAPLEVRRRLADPSVDLFYARIFSRTHPSTRTFLRPPARIGPAATSLTMPLQPLRPRQVGRRRDFRIRPLDGPVERLYEGRRRPTVTADSALGRARTALAGRQEAAQGAAWVGACCWCWVAVFFLVEVTDTTFCNGRRADGGSISRARQLLSLRHPLQNDHDGHLTAAGPPFTPANPLCTKSTLLTSRACLTFLALRSR